MPTFLLTLLPFIYIIFGFVGIYLFFTNTAKMVGIGLLVPSIGQLIGQFIEINDVGYLFFLYIGFFIMVAGSYHKKPRPTVFAEPTKEPI